MARQGHLNTHKSRVTGRNQFVYSYFNVKFLSCPNECYVSIIVQQFVVFFFFDVLETFQELL